MKNYEKRKRAYTICPYVKTTQSHFDMLENIFANVFSFVKNLYIAV